MAMMWIGIVLLVIGGGSVVLSILDFEPLNWADSVQPWAGIAIALIGVGLVAAAGAQGKRTAAIGDDSELPG